VNRRAESIDVVERGMPGRFPGYANAILAELTAAIAVRDAFDVVKLGHPGARAVDLTRA